LPADDPAITLLATESVNGREKVSLAAVKRLHKQWDAAGHERALEGAYTQTLSICSRSSKESNA